MDLIGHWNRCGPEAESYISCQNLSFTTVFLRRLDQTMQWLLFLVLPTVFAAPATSLTTTQKTPHGIISSLAHFMHVDKIQELVQQLYTNLGSDQTEQACEAQCKVLILQDHILQFACPLVCHSFQQLVSHYNINHQKKAVNWDPLHLLDKLGAVFNSAELHKLVNDLYNTLGSDATEAACESQCNRILTAEGLLHHGCPLVCHGFQTLIVHFGLHPATSSPVVGKRNLVDTLLKIFNGGELHKVVNDLYNTLGSDATEQQCESQCNRILQADGLLHHGCPLICHGFQTLVQHYGIQLITAIPPDPIGKRLILDGSISLGTIFQQEELKNLVADIQTSLGGDETEALCETRCNTLIKQEHVLHFGCPLICKSFQQLVNHFHLPTSAPAHP